MRRLNLLQILNATLECCNISAEEWERLFRGRKGHIVRAKQLLSLIASDEGYSSSEIAEFLGQDRTTVIHNVKVLREQIVLYPSIQDLADEIEVKLVAISGHQKQMVARGWLARSSTGLLTISPSFPERLGGYWMAEGSKPFPREQFPQVTYETGPVEVKIKVTLENEKM